MGPALKSTLRRRRREEWMELGLMERLRRICLEAYDRLVGLELSDLVVHGCISKAQKAEGRRPARARWTLRQRWPKALHGGGRREGIPLGPVMAPANRHDSPLLVPTLKAATETLGSLPQEASVHLETGAATRFWPASAFGSWGFLGGRSRGRRASLRRLIGPRIGGS